MTADPQTTVIEINGVKLEVDLRTAKRVDTLRVGSKVKCLVKQYQGWKTYPGIVVGFEPFKTKPSIVVSYLDDSYNAEIQFMTYNADVTDFEIVADTDNNALEINRDGMLARMQRDIDQKQREVETLEAKRQFFLDNFGRYFSESSEG